MTVSLIRVGNSKAVIIPAGILRRLNITENSILELQEREDSGSIIISRTSSKREVPVFPKIAVPDISEQEFASFRDGLVAISEKEIEEDERLSYILEKL